MSAANVSQLCATERYLPAVDVRSGGDWTQVAVRALGILACDKADRVPGPIMFDAFPLCFDTRRTILVSSKRKWTSLHAK
jgi:hypothetical protein